MKTGTKSLDRLLDDITVGEVDGYHNEANNGKLDGVMDWYYVVTDDGVVAYFNTERAALFYRLCLINATLNKIA